MPDELNERHEGHWWGRRPPKVATVAWGARAIYSPPTGIDVLPDRQSLLGDGEAKRALVDWINANALKKLRRHLKREPLSPSSSETILIAEDGYVIEASTNASYGYLYIGVWPLNPGSE